MSKWKNFTRAEMGHILEFSTYGAVASTDLNFFRGMAAHIESSCCKHILAKIN